MTTFAIYNIGSLWDWSDARLAPFANSLEFYCQTCGKSWAKVRVEHDGETSPWWVRFIPCERHVPINCRDWGTIPGAITSAIDPNWPDSFPQADSVRALPPKVLEREFELIMKYWEKENESRE
jgi:hypothetical protein